MRQRKEVMNNKRTFPPAMTGSKRSSKLNSAMETVQVHLSRVTLVCRVGMYSSKAATSSEVTAASFSSLPSKMKMMKRQ